MNQSRLRVVAPFVEGFRTNVNYWRNMDELIRDSRNVHFHFIVKNKNNSNNLPIQKLEEKYPESVTHSFAKTNEYLWDSLIKVELGKSEWILQIHQDDDWSGYIDFPNNLENLDTIFFEFQADKITQEADKKNLDVFPGRAAFCAVPREIWEILLLVSKEMSWKVAPSFDSVLAEIVKSYGNLKQQKSFSYQYSAKNWKSKLARRRHLASLMKYDVWRYAPVEMSVINRDLDLICSRMLISNLMGNQILPTKEGKIYGVSLTRTPLNSIKFLAIKTSLFCRLSFTFKLSKREEVMMKIAYLEFTSKIIDLCQDRDHLIEYLIYSLYNPKLVIARDRISFWVKHI